MCAFQCPLRTKLCPANYKSFLVPRYNLKSPNTRSATENAHHARLNKIHNFHNNATLTFVTWFSLVQPFSTTTILTTYIHRHISPYYQHLFHQFWIINVTTSEFDFIDQLLHRNLFHHNFVFYIDLIRFIFFHSENLDTRSAKSFWKYRVRWSLIP